MDTTKKASARNNRHFSKRYFYSGNYHTQTTIRLTQYNKTDLQIKRVDLECNSFSELIDPGCINWFEVKGLSDDTNITRMLYDFGMHSLDAREILTPSHIVKIDNNEKYISVVLNSCSISRDHHIHSDHVSVIVTDKVVLTFNEGNAPLFENVDNALKENIMNIREQKSGMLFAFLMNSIMADLIESAVKMERELETLENMLLTRRYNQKEIGTNIQRCRRTYLIIRKNSYPLLEEFDNIMKPKEGIILKSMLPVFKDIKDQLNYIVQTTKNSNDILTSLVDLYVSNNDFRMNAIMKTLTIVSTIFAPITFLVGLWGMNFRYMPELELKYGYLYAWISILLVGFGTWGFMKNRKWF